MTRVVEIMKEEEKEKKNEVEEKRRKAAVVSQPSAEATIEYAQGASAICSSPEEGKEPETLASKEEQTLLQDKAREKEDEDILVRGSLDDVEADSQLQESEGRQVPDIPETLRVKGQKWTPPQGHRRCSGNCLGCQRKCKDLGIEDCQSCHLNTLKNTNSNGSCNRDACTNLRVIKPKKGKSNLGEESLLAAQSELSQVDSIVNNFEKKGVENENQDMEEDIKKGLKRNRVKGGTPEDIKRSSQIARTTGTGGTSRLVAPKKACFPSK